MIAPEQPRASNQSQAIRPDLFAHDVSSLPRGSRAASPIPRTDPTDSKLSPLSAADKSTSANHRDASPRHIPGGRYFRDASTRLDPYSRSSSRSPFRLEMPTISPGQLAFSAMQYLPVPVMVLNNLKTVVLANEAMGRMMGLSPPDSDDDESSLVIDSLRGQTLSQVGIDMMQDGRPIWVAWENFFDTLVSEMGVRAAAPDADQQSLDNGTAGNATPTAGTLDGDRLGGLDGVPARRTRDAVVEVVLTRKDIGIPIDEAKARQPEPHSFAKMMVTIWEVEDRQIYFTLTFTSTQSPPSSVASYRRAIARSSSLEAADRRTIHHSNPPSVASSKDSYSPSICSPGVVTMSSSPFPPMGPPSTAAHSSAPSMLRKMMLMKDALLDNTQVPIVAMWKDGSVTIPNKAARKQFYHGGEVEPSGEGTTFLRNWKLYTEDFSRELHPEEYPISQLIREETPFESIRVGLYNQEGKKLIFDVVGETIRDVNTGEFLAGVVTGRDVTTMTEEITQIKARDEERFKLICDTMPQLVWTARPDGSHDFFNTRWYSYTGLTPEQSLGSGWVNPFHPDDAVLANKRWQHCLKTGDPYVVEYRCRSASGEWKWFLGRALPFRNQHTGEIAQI
jgi:PAS domain S-box-containing protein